MPEIQKPQVNISTLRLFQLPQWKMSGAE